MSFGRLVLTLLVAVPSAVVAQAPDGVMDLRLRPGDMVRVQVGDEAGLSDEYPVTEEGVVLLPMVGVVRVAGRPFAQVRDEIRDRYARELLDAPVLATPVLRIPVLGEVQQPGLMPVDPTLTLADVVAAAGGLTGRGDPSRVVLIRDGRAVRLSLEADELDGTRSLLPGDRIVVGRRSWLSENLNAVLAAGATVLAATITSLVLR